MNNFAAQLLLEHLKDTHEVLEQTMDGVDNEVAHFMPPGKANPIAGTYAHAIFSEDMFVQGMLRQQAPLYETTYKDNTGASEVQPTDFEVAYPKWLREVKLDVDKFREYAKAVYAASEEYVNSLTDEDLQKDVDMSSFSMDKRPVSSFLTNFIIGHAGSITGEISVLKGIQGLKGYPF